MPIVLEHVTYRYDVKKPESRPALLDVSAILPDHSFTALIGQTGSGKSTFIQHLNGLLLPTTGKIDVNGYLIDMSPVYRKTRHGEVLDDRAMKKKHKKKQKNIKDLRKKVGLVFQFPEYQIFEETVLKDVCYGPKNFGKSQKESEDAAKEALTLVGLDESFYNRSPFELSGGEKRRVAIAGILALKPDILVLDEPTVGLDAEGEKNLMGLLSTIYSKGTSIILATHNMDVVLKYAHRVLVLDKGRIVSDSTPLALFQNEDFLKNSSLLPPHVFRFAMELIRKGMKLDLANIRDADSLADEIARVKESKQ